MIDMETNMLIIEARSHRDGIRTALESNVQATQPRVDVMQSSGMNEQIPFPHMNMSISEYDSETLRGSYRRPQEPGMQENSVIPQLDGLPSIPSRNQGEMLGIIRIGQDYPCDGTYFQGTSASNRREYPGDSSDDNWSYRSQRYPNQRGRPPDEERYPNRDRRPPRRGRSQDDGRPPNGHGGPPRHSRGQGPPGPRGPPGPVRPIIVQQPQVVLDTTFLENTFDTTEQSMLQLARVQDQMNHHLQQHIQQGQLNMQAHAGALQQLATSTHQWNYDISLQAYPYMMETIERNFFPWLDHLEAACYYCGRDIKTEALGRSAGPVQNVIMALPHTKSWSAIREELKRCFSDQILLGHTAAQLENMTQKPNGPLRLHIYQYSNLHKTVTQKDAYHDTDPSRWFRFLTSITNTLQTR